MKEITFEIPKGYELDEENSTDSKLVYKLKEQEIKIWKDIKTVEGFFINLQSGISACSSKHTDNTNQNVAIDKKHCKSMIAMAQISQLMPYYGGAITAEEWGTIHMQKHVIYREANNISRGTCVNSYELLAFHTEEQRDDFLKYNEQLVKDYLMIE